MKMLVVLTLIGLYPLGLRAQLTASQDVELLSYTDSDGRFSFTYPAGFADRPSVRAAYERQAASPHAAPLQKCVVVPLSVLKRDESDVSSLSLLQAKSVCAHLDGPPDVLLQGFTEGLLKPMSAQLSHVSEPLRYKIGGHEAVMVQGSIETVKRNTYLRIACAVLAKDVSCWELTSTSADLLRSLSGLQIAIDGLSPVPLVPVKHQPWQP